VNNRREIIQQLTEELNRETAHFLEVQRAEVEIIKEAPSGIPLPDGKQRIIQAAREARLAFQSYQQALKRYRAFLADGTLAEEDLGENETGK